MNHSEIAEYITELRISHGYSQLYLSQVLGIGRQAYSHYETGRNLPTYQSIVGMAELYDIPTDVFISKMHLDASKRSELEACFRIMKDQEKSGHVLATDHLNQTDTRKPVQQVVKSPAITAAVSYMEKLENEKQKKVLELIKWYVDN
ncbi:MAG: helix-turn-helix transcriptional regulator [Lachnospiraceae bacterium]|nr:helix-turn-helix transcriptional regulator [Lachnospiraceae bacterium]